MPPLKQYKVVHPRAKSKSDLLLAVIESFVLVLLWRWIKISLSWSRQVKSAPLPSSRKIRPVRSLYSCWIGFPHQGPQVGDVPFASPRQIEAAPLPSCPGNVENAFLVASCLLRLVSFPSSCQVRLGSLSRCWSEIFNNRARWNFQCHYFHSRRVDSYVKLNFKASLFSCIFWFEDSLLCKIILLIFGLFTL